MNATYELPSPDSQKQWGMFGYPGTMCDRALAADNPDMLRACMAKGWIDAETRMLNGTVLEHADKHAPRCAEVLREAA